MKYTFIETHKLEHSVKKMLKALGIKRSEYYAWQYRPIIHREKMNCD
jgi:hypothetical protein